jgi:hypothetical protein
LKNDAELRSVGDSMKSVTGKQPGSLRRRHASVLLQRGSAKKMRARDRWAHRAEMIPGASSNPTSARSVDVSLITSSLPSSNAVAADVVAVAPQIQTQTRSGVVADNSQSLVSLPEPVGSSVPPTAPASLVPAGRKVDNTPRNCCFSVCSNYGGNHHVSICQECDPWEYNARFLAVKSLVLASTQSLPRGR